MKTLSERFFSHTNIGGVAECWLWLGASHNGLALDYGTFRVGDKVLYAHRVSYEIANGPIPEGLDVLHTCDNKKCVNPNHLYLGTQANNTTDSMQRGTVSHNPGRLGHAGGKFLREGEVWLVRKLKILIYAGKKKCYKFPASYVAKMFKTSPSTIHKIWNSEKVWCKEGYYT